MATSSTMNSELIDQFVAVTGAGRNVAVNLLEACAGNLDMAVGMHMDSGGAGPSDTAAIGGDATEDNEGVRAPIPQKTEILVEEEIGKYDAWRMKRPRRTAPSVFDGFRNFQSEAYNFEETMRGKKPSKRKNLEDLFRPPVDVTYKGTFHNARRIGSTQNKWLLVNVQNVQEFPCQLLNRDVWSHAEARSIIHENFIFWQVYHDSEEGKRFLQFYKLTQWPYVAVIDPFTGENQIVWNKIADGNVFCELAREFLSSCPVPDTSLGPQPAKRSRREPSIVDATEQEQMEAAIKASLVDSAIKPSSPEYVLDSDSEADVVEDSDEVETFSDSDDIIVSSPPGTSNGVASSKIPSPSTSNQQSPRKKTVPSRTDHVKKSRLLSPSRRSASSSSASSSQLSSSQPLPALPLGSLSRLSPSTSGDSGSLDRDGAGPSVGPRRNIWAAGSSSEFGRDSPLEVNIESSLIDMIGCREAEVCTPEVCTVDDSPPDSQASTSEVELIKDSKEISQLSTQASEQHSSQQDSQSSTQSLNQDTSQSSTWKDFWGDPADEMSNIMIRFPDNKREQISLPSSSQLKALTTYCAAQGYPTDKYELVTNFPRRKLSQMEGTSTLKEVGLHPQETVFVQDL